MGRGMSWRGGAIGLALLCGMALWWNVTAAEEEEVPTQSSSTRAATSRSADTSRSTRASDTGEARIEAKLDQILANQDQILAKLDQVMEELKIVKIRATVR